MWAAELPSPIHTHTHYKKKGKTRTLECKNVVQKLKIPHVKNVETRKSLDASKISK